MEPMTREKMIETCRAYCKDRPVLSGCTTCKIKQLPPRGFGCVPIEERTDDQLAADIEKIMPKAPVEEELVEQSEPEPVRPAPAVTVTVDRDMLVRVQGGLVMLSAVLNAGGRTQIYDQITGMTEAIQRALDDASLAQMQEAEHAEIP